MEELLQLIDEKYNRDIINKKDNKVMIDNVCIFTDKELGQKQINFHNKIDTENEEDDYKNLDESKLCQFLKENPFGNSESLVEFFDYIVDSKSKNKERIILEALRWNKCVITEKEIISLLLKFSSSSLLSSSTSSFLLLNLKVDPPFFSRLLAAKKSDFNLRIFAEALKSLISALESNFAKGIYPAFGWLPTLKILNLTLVVKKIITEKQFEKNEEILRGISAGSVEKRKEKDVGEEDVKRDFQGNILEQMGKIRTDLSAEVVHEEILAI